jgi:dTDP-glucose pyrophosphorylase
MKGIIPAAGKAKRLGGKCKALTLIDGEYLLAHPLKNMLNLGVKEVIIIQHGREIEKEFGNEWNGIKLTYVQQRQRKGIAHAISLAERLIRDYDTICIILGDIIYKGDDLAVMKSAFELSALDALVAFKMIADKSEIKKSYGYLRGKFVEKPEDTSDFPNFLGLGIYMAKPDFFEAIARTKPSERGEIEITDTLNQIEKIQPFILRGFYTNVNTREELKTGEEELRRLQSGYLGLDK